MTNSIEIAIAKSVLCSVSEFLARAKKDHKQIEETTTRKADKRRRPPSPVLAHSAFYLSPAVAVEAVASQFLPPHRIALFHVAESIEVQ